MSMSHLLVLLDLMQFGVGNDSFKLVEPFLHQSEAEPGRLLLLPDSFKLSPPHLLGNTGTLLPLLDPLREDLIDTTEEQKQTVMKHSCKPAGGLLVQSQNICVQVCCRL